HRHGRRGFGGAAHNTVALPPIAGGISAGRPESGSPHPREPDLAGGGSRGDAPPLRLNPPSHFEDGGDRNMVGRPVPSARFLEDFNPVEAGAEIRRRPDMVEPAAAIGRFPVLG